MSSEPTVTLQWHSYLSVIEKHFTNKVLAWTSDPRSKTACHLNWQSRSNDTTIHLSLKNVSLTSILINPSLYTACALNSSKHTVFVWTMTQNTIQESGRVPSNAADFCGRRQQFSDSINRFMPTRVVGPLTTGRTFSNHFLQKPFPSRLHVNVFLTTDRTSLKTTTEKHLCFNANVSYCPPKLSPGIICHASTLNSGSVSYTHLTLPTMAVV